MKSAFMSEVRTNIRKVSSELDKYNHRNVLSTYLYDIIYGGDLTWETNH